MHLFNVLSWGGVGRDDGMMVRWYIVFGVTYSKGIWGHDSNCIAFNRWFCFNETLERSLTESTWDDM